MERIIAEARRNSQPAYIAVPSDYALSPVVWADVKPIMPRSKTQQRYKRRWRLSQTYRQGEIHSRISRLYSFPAWLAESRHRRRSKRWVVLFVTTLMEKCVIDESHPQFAGMYAGAVSEPKTRQIIESADLVLDLGRRQFERHHHGGLFRPTRSVRVCYRRPPRRQDRRPVIANVRLEDILSELAKLKPSSATYRGNPPGLAP